MTRKLAKEMCPAPMLDKNPVQILHNAELLRHTNCLYALCAYCPAMQWQLMY